MLPPIPPWIGIHPIIVHFPIALLLTAPVFLVLAVALPKMRMGFSLSAFVLMLLGTIGAYVAVASGQAASDFVSMTDDIERVLDEHKAHGEDVRTYFTILTAVFAALIVTVWRLGPSLKHRYFAAACGVFLAIYMAASLLVVITGDLGGRLVHEYGVQALVASDPGPDATPVVAVASPTNELGARR